VAAAAVARGRVADARSDHGAQSRLPQRLAPEAPSSVVWACEAAGEAGHRARRGHWVMRARTRGLPNSRPPLALTHRQLLDPSSCETFYATSVKCPWAPTTLKGQPSHVLGFRDSGPLVIIGSNQQLRACVTPSPPSHGRVTFSSLTSSKASGSGLSGAPRPVDRTAVRRRRPKRKKAPSTNRTFSHVEAKPLKC
jgi:hypothetical protein